MHERKRNLAAHVRWMERKKEGRPKQFWVQIHDKPLTFEAHKVDPADFTG